MTKSGSEIRFGDAWMYRIHNKQELCFLAKKRTEKMEIDIVKEFTRKRYLILELVAQEVSSHMHSMISKKLKGNNIFFLLVRRWIF